MDEHSDDVMIALLPTTANWCTLDLPHMTLVFCGKIMDLPMAEQNQMAKHCLDLALTVPQIELTVMSQEVFGPPEGQVDVFTLRPDADVLALYDQVKQWDDGSHPFTPHVTVGPVGTVQDRENIPDTIQFDRIALSWGNSLLPYRLNL